MHPLSIFPTLLSFGFFAPLLLRVTVSVFVVYLGLNRKDKMYNWMAFIYYIVGLLVFVGMYTQVAVIVGIVLLKIDFYFDYWKDRNVNPVPVEKYFTYAMAIVILLTLLLTGPGAFARDYPL